MQARREGDHAVDRVGKGGVRHSGDLRLRRCDLLLVIADPSQPVTLTPDVGAALDALSIDRRDALVGGAVSG